jgi:CelD/BcsL family acetyltransferase involved in cellulose biosynthesis
LKPGLVSHCCAVQHSVEAGMKTYDLLMGRQRFKQNLATHSGEMVWLVLQKPRMRFRLERAAKHWRHQLRGAGVPSSPNSNEASRED